MNRLVALIGAIVLADTSLYAALAPLLTGVALGAGLGGALGQFAGDGLPYGLCAALLLGTAGRSADRARPQRLRGPRRCIRLGV